MPSSVSMAAMSLQDLRFIPIFLAGIETLCIKQEAILPQHNGEHGALGVLGQAVREMNRESVNPSQIHPAGH